MGAFAKFAEQRAVKGWFLVSRSINLISTSNQAPTSENCF